MLKKITNFLQSELGISTAAISLAQKSPIVEPNLLPIILWQYGFISTEELDRVFDWLETV
ncbi:DUF2949 domain-containing protein [Myxosarcina sp. GI1(2024)]